MCKFENFQTSRIVVQFRIVFLRHIFDGQFEFVRLALVVVAGSDDRLLRRRIEGGRGQVHDGEIASLITTNGFGHAMLAIVTDLKDFL